MQGVDMNMSQHKYYNFKETLASKPKLLTTEQLNTISLNPNKDYYLSIFKYNEEHKKAAEASGSVASIKDVVTDTLVWDFDSEKNIEKARQDTLELGRRLVEQYNVDPDIIYCYTSGNKGFHVVVPINKEITPEQFKQAITEVAKGLETFDTSVSDHARILRMEHTKHPKSGLYKIPLHLAEIEEMTVEQIKERAKEDRDESEAGFKAGTAVLSEKLFAVPEKKKEVTKVELESASEIKNPPKGWKPYKWALAQGFFDSGERHQALMVIAATCRSLGYDKEATYYLCKSALKKQSARTGQEEFPKEELWSNIIEDSVFSDRWEGGSYSPQNNPWLKAYCDKHGFDGEEKEEPPCIGLDILTDQFTNYATNFEQNIIKTGIKGLDDNVIFSTSTLNGILGQPGSGKTTMALNYLRNTSMAGIPSMFFSLDMGAPLVYAKLVQKATGHSFKKALELYRTDPKERDRISQVIKTEYKNVGFNFKAGLTVADMRDAIIKHTEATGISPKLIVVDYLENIAGPYSDATANAGLIANQLKDLANETETSIALLLQTQKHSTPDVSDPLLSMKQIKGSSVIEQACSTVLTLWREGYSPNTVDDDRYISFAVVKNRFGSLWQGDFSWEPIRGDIKSLSEEQYEELQEFRKRKKEQKAKDAEEARQWQ
jgi:KaiC/GvpD/RAD55 family RecA-like ATPase